ncbi:MAG: chemotaxis protein CheW [Candidatus Omnitrophica bacterium]|nr:chemotaxis protein CheW [Candidatus Omnitrophota bacterium]
MQVAAEKAKEVLTQGDIREFVCFKLADEEYALDITNVQEVVRVPRITPVPQMPEFCLGVINIRGSIMPVFDLRKKFHLDVKEFDAKTKILVVIVDGVMISLVVDEVLEKLKLNAAAVDPAPIIKMKMEKEAVEGIGKVNGRMIVILFLPKIHEAIKLDISRFSTAAAV